MLSTDLPDVAKIEAECEKAGAALLKVAGILNERRKASKLDDWYSIELEWECIEKVAHSLLKVLALPVER